MKINLASPTFKAVLCVGSTNHGEKDTSLNFEKQLRRANTTAKYLEEQGRDVYVVESVTHDAKGEKTDHIDTYVLIDEDARPVTKFDGIKSLLVRLFNEQNRSDSFDLNLQNKLDSISREQAKIAEFIAVNRKTTRIPRMEY